MPQRSMGTGHQVPASGTVTTDSGEAIPAAAAVAAEIAAEAEDITGIGGVPTDTPPTEALELIGEHPIISC